LIVWGEAVTHLLTVRSLDAICLWVLAAAALFSLAGTALLLLYRRRARPPLDGETPVTVLKPMAGSFPGVGDALETFFLQTHRRYQLVFGFRSADDPARAVVEQLRRKHRQVDCESVVIGEDIGPNRKVSALHHMLTAAKHDLLLISDDDVSVPPDYVARLVGSMHDPRTGLVTSPYRVRPRSMGLALDGLTRATELLPSVALSERLEGGLSFSLGASSIVRRKALEDIGGFPALADFLAEDYFLGARIRAKGWNVRLSTEVVELSHDFRTAREYAVHQVRWSRTYRFCRPIGYLLSILTQGTFLSCIALLLTGASAAAAIGAGVTVLVRLLTAATDIALVGHRSLMRWLPLVLLRDLLSVGFWVVGFLGNRVEWRGRTLRITAGGRIATAVPKATAMLGP
jgi:ceramide glucosyltransferase